MLRNLVPTVSALAALLACATLAMAQATQPPAQIQTQSAQTNTDHGLRAKAIMGATVSLQGNNNAGTVQDIVLNDDGVVEYLIVSEGGKLVSVPWEAAKFNFERRTVTINITQDQFRQVPTFTAERYPDFSAPAYRTQVYRYYNLTPGRERRLERREERRP